MRSQLARMIIASCTVLLLTLPAGGYKFRTHNGITRAATRLLREAPDTPDELSRFLRDFGHPERPGDPIPSRAGNPDKDTKTDEDSQEASLHLNNAPFYDGTSLECFFE